MWQDKIIAACQVGAIVALLPIIFGKDKPAAISCFMNFLFPAIISLALFTLHFWFSMTTAGIISLCWLIIGIQKLRQIKSAESFCLEGALGHRRLRGSSAQACSE